MWDIEGAEEERRGLESAAEAEAEKDNYRENGSEDKKMGGKKMRKTERERWEKQEESSKKAMLHFSDTTDRVCRSRRRDGGRESERRGEIRTEQNMSRHREGEREREGESTLQVKCEIKKM